MKGFVSCISSPGGRACLLLHHVRRTDFLTPGVHGEGEVLADGDREVEGLTLAAQCLAEVQALGKQGGANCSHFGLTSELVKS